ncbi:MAG: hypothetical protein KC550_06735, partial [Nanoarchaeota archaeon]|nr:hypothetical protein [Nanoarchaeota archaeon]
ESISPNPVKPGQDVVLEFKIINLKTDELLIKKVNLDLRNNFQLKTTNNDYNGETFCSKCTKSLIYYLNAKPQLQSGIYSIEIEIVTESFSIKKDVLIKVQGEPTLIMDAQVDNNITVGLPFSVNFNLKNRGTNDANNIKISSLSNEIGFLNENFLYVDFLKQNGEVNLKGFLTSSKDILTGYYQVPLLIEYEDNQNLKYQVNEKIGIDILDKANIILQNVKMPSKLYVGEEFELSLRVENDGYGKAKNVNIILDGEVQGLKEGFFGTIARGEDYPHVFKLIPRKSGLNEINLQITYNDDYGFHSINYPLSLEVDSNLKSYTNYYYIGGVVFLILLLIFFIKKSSSKNQNLDDY